MRIIALLSWYDEAPSWLAATITSFAPHVDYLVAVDGAYGSYPGGRPKSDPAQAETILRTCDAAGIGVTIHQPQTVFMGNEVDKRSLMFSIAATHADPFEDWYWVIDGDEVLTKAPNDLRTRLQYVQRHAAEVTLWTRDNWSDTAPDVAHVMPLPGESRSSMRMLFRAMPNMRVMGRHDVYVADDKDGEPVLMWGPHDLNPVDAENLLDVQVEHRSTKRDAARRAASYEYYRVRDGLGLESIGRRMMEGVDGNPVQV